jgi:hypothetical protein
MASDRIAQSGSMYIYTRIRAHVHMRRNETELLFITPEIKEGSVARDNRPWSSLDRERILNTAHRSNVAFFLNSAGSKDAAIGVSQEKIALCIQRFLW